MEASCMEYGFIKRRYLHVDVTWDDPIPIEGNTEKTWSIMIILMSTTRRLGKAIPG